MMTRVDEEKEADERMMTRVDGVRRWKRRLTNG